MLEAEVDAEIAALGAKWGCPLGPGQVAGIAAFFRLLLLWNTRLNLTGARSMDDLVQEHLPDSFALGRLTPASVAVVDVGAGGGLPGVPFALLRPDCRVTLVEPRAKRAAFLATALRSIGGGHAFELIRGRDSDAPTGAFQVAASRATFRPREWLRVAGPLLGGNGRVVAFAALPLGEEEVGLRLIDSVGYSNGLGASRWAGAYVPRGTLGSPR